MLSLWQTSGNVFSQNHLVIEAKAFFQIVIYLPLVTHLCADPSHNLHDPESWRAAGRDLASR